MSVRDARAARLIADHWLGGRKLAALPDDCRPRTVADGYAAQRALAEALDDRVVGWKIAATSASGQRHIGVDGPLAGRLFARRLRENGDRIPIADNRMRVAECEFAFVLERDLPPREQPYSPRELLEAIATLHPALELPDSRFDAFASAGAAQLVADDACAHWFVLGPAASGRWRDVDLAAHRTRLVINGLEVTAGTGVDVLGGPLAALAWIANCHRLRGAGLAAGDIVTTGVTGRPSPIAPGDRVEADLGELGRVAATMAP